MAMDLYKRSIKPSPIIELEYDSLEKSQIRRKSFADTLNSELNDLK